MTIFHPLSSHVVLKNVMEGVHRNGRVM